MGASVNRVILIGNLGANPELKYTPSGQAVCELRVATNESYTDKQGERHDKTEWHRVVAWGKTAENCSQYLSKGRSVYVEGRLQTRKWEDKEGQTRYTTEIVAERVQFLGGKGAGASDEGESDERPRRNGRPASSSPAPADAGPPGPGGSDDDIPF